VNANVFYLLWQLHRQASAEQRIALADPQISWSELLTIDGDFDLLDTKITGIEDEGLFRVGRGAFDGERGGAFEGVPLEIDGEVEIDVANADVFGVGVGVIIAFRAQAGRGPECEDSNHGQRITEAQHRQSLSIWSAAVFA